MCVRAGLVAELLAGHATAALHRSYGSGMWTVDDALSLHWEAWKMPEYPNPLPLLADVGWWLRHKVGGALGIWSKEKGN